MTHLSVFFTWSGYPHLVVEFGWVWGADPGPRAGVEGGRVVVLWACHVWAVGAQHVWVGGRSVHTPSSRGQVQEAAACPRPPQRAQALGLQGLLKPGALPAISPWGRVSVSGGGEGGGDSRGVEGCRGVWVQLGAAPGGGRGAVGWAQRVADRPVQQLEVAEEARRAEHLTDFRQNKVMLFFGTLGKKMDLMGYSGWEHWPELCL